MSLPTTRPSERTAPARLGGFLFLTQADTDILALSKVVPRLGPDFPPVRAYNLLRLDTDEAVAGFLATVLPLADVVILRLLGGRSGFRTGFERVVDHVRRHQQWLVCLPGTDTLDPELTAVSNVGVPVTHEAFAYLQLGGLKNYEHLLRYLSDRLLQTGFGCEPPEPQPRHGVYHPDVPEGTLEAWRRRADPARPTLGVLFYRAHWLSGNTDFVDALVRAGEARGATVLPVFAYSLFADARKEYAEGQESPGQDGRLPAALGYFVHAGRPAVDVIISTMSFALGGVGGDRLRDGAWSTEVLRQLDVPVIQAITASSTYEQWSASLRGLTPLDTAMNVAIPEFDGRIIGVPISFKEETTAGDRGSSPAADRQPELTDGAKPLCTSSGAPALGVPVVRYAPRADRVERVIGQALRLVALRHKPNREKRIAFVLTNYNAKAARIGNAVGLDTPASLLRVLEAMRAAGYTVGETPLDGDALLQLLISHGSYDLEVVTEAQLDGAVARVPAAKYGQWFAALPAKNRAEMAARWEPPPGRHYVDGRGALALAGLEFGNVFVAVQPPRGYGLDPSAIYHQPDLPPPHPYHALYRWLAEPLASGGWGADAIVHLGKHGTLEWLPGKGLGVSAECYPDLFLRDLPLVYPFIINDPGEGAQAKRRTHAVIVDHMTPPMTTADGYGEIEQLARVVDEYYQLEQLDPSKLPLLQQQIWDLIRQARLDVDLDELLHHGSDDHAQVELGPSPPACRSSACPNTGRGGGAAPPGLPPFPQDWGKGLGDEGRHSAGPHPLPAVPEPGPTTGPGSGTAGRAAPEEGVPHTLTSLSGRSFAHLVEDINGYLCELTSAPIRDGLHILGQTPTGPQLVDTLLSLVRVPNLDVPSLRAGVASHFGLDIDAILGDLGRRLEAAPRALQVAVGRRLATHADALEAIDLICHRLVEGLVTVDFVPAGVPTVLVGILGVRAHHEDTKDTKSGAEWGEVARTLHFVCAELVPNLRRTDDEIRNLLHALDGGYVPSGPSGAPTRGMAHVLPTGRNFYAVDPRSLPGLAAWHVGQQLADALLARHLQDEGRYPESVGISIWGTSAMRTHGDDIAEVLALIGVRPRWQAESRRVTGLELIPLAELGRPRIDVVCRISGFFRDAFPHLITLLDQAFRMVATADEPSEQNFVRCHQLAHQERLAAAGVPTAEAARTASYRIFGCKPGTYGAGILPLIDERNWRGAADFAEAYVNWGGYAYTGEAYGVDARAAFRQALSGVQVAVKNQDNREHDIFDSDDYLQYHGGMIATIRALTGQNPRRYFGDSADPQRARVRDLKEEALRVFRTRVVNPKWIDAIQRHGYKGALELAATVDYLFGYDATAEVVDDWMYTRLAETYVLDPQLEEFFRQSNPWARRDIAERLLEAIERGMWEHPSDEIQVALRQAYLRADSDVEGRTVL